MAHSQATRLAALAALIADETRATFCLALLDGRAWTAGELARTAGVSRSTATEHLNRLVAGGLLTEERQGRHRYVRLADADTAHLIEDLAARLPSRPAAPRTLADSAANRAMARARTCYDHLAGRLGVTITAAMAQRGFIRQAGGFHLTNSGEQWLERLEIDVRPLRSARRPMVRACLDFTERRPHLAGSVGAALLRASLDRDWVVPIGTKRALRLTPTGSQALHAHLGIDPADLEIF